MWSYIMDLGDNSSVDAFASKKCIVEVGLFVKYFFCK